MPEPERIVAVAAIAAIVWSGALLFGQYAAGLPGPVRTAGYAVGVFIVAVAAAITLNAVTGTPPTPGVKALAVVAVLIAVPVVRGAWWSWRHDRHRRP